MKTHEITNESELFGTIYEFRRYQETIKNTNNIFKIFKFNSIRKKYYYLIRDTIYKKGAVNIITFNFLYDFCILLDDKQFNFDYTFELFNGGIVSSIKIEPLAQVQENHRCIKIDINVDKRKSYNRYICEMNVNKFSYMIIVRPDVPIYDRITVMSYINYDDGEYKIKENVNRISMEKFSKTDNDIDPFSYLDVNKFYGEHSRIIWEVLMKTLLYLTFGE